MLSFWLSGCGVRNDLAPVSELKWHPYSAHQTHHVVRRGETLYAIAFGYDTDYRQLANINHLRPPYALRIGQVLNLQGMRTVSHLYRRPSYAVVKNKQQPHNNRRPLPFIFMHGRWLWPVQGRVVTGFLPSQGKKGINVASKKGERVHASSGGVVAYAGSGLSGYGNLIIIKHDNEYLTAYGNNAKNLVSEGQRVKAGQVIAEVGVIDRKYWGVHFEIRKQGVPVNPLSFLK